jgi:hypothetical protein
MNARGRRRCGRGGRVTEICLGIVSFGDATRRLTMAAVPNWRASGDWFDACKCDVVCPCTFAQTPTYGDCEGINFWHIREGSYGDVGLNGLNVLALLSFEGNIWAGETKMDIGIFFDERADEAQREALQTIFSGQAGGWPAALGDLIGNMRGVEFAPIEFDVSEDLEWWSARIPGRVEARGEALTGPTALEGQRVQIHNPPGSEVGPGVVVTAGIGVTDQAEGFGFRWERSGQSSKHIAFQWSGPN